MVECANGAPVSCENRLLFIDFDVDWSDVICYVSNPLDFGKVLPIENGNFEPLGTVNQTVNANDCIRWHVHIVAEDCTDRMMSFSLSRSRHRSSVMRPFNIYGSNENNKESVLVSLNLASF